MRIGLGLELGRQSGGDPGLALMGTADSWYSSKDGAVDVQERASRITGTDLATFGSTSGVDANDPTRLIHDGHNYVWFTRATVGNYLIIQSADHVFPTASTQSEWVFRRVDPVGVGTQYLFWQGADRCYITVNATTAAFIFDKSSDQSSYGVSTAMTDANTKVWLKGTVDWPASTPGAPTVTFYYSDESDVWDADDVTWTLGNSTVAGVDVDTPTAAVQMFINTPGNTSLSIDGGIHTVKITHNDGADVQLDLNMDTATLAATSITDSNGVELGVARAAAGLKLAVVTRSVDLFDGVDDYIKLPASDAPTFTATTGKHTVVVAFRTFVTSGGYNRLWGWEPTPNDGTYLCLSNTGKAYAVVGGTTTFANSEGATAIQGDWELRVAAIVVDDTTVAAYSNEDGLDTPTSTTGVGTVVFGSNGYVGKTPGSADVYQGEFFEVLSFPGVALTETELDLIAAKLIAGTYS